ncbi:MAG TPA: HAMP domain-containing sensor histidine kinase [Afifellaceae bacterium]|nr:HAMP domain-containing sensor histidine kinase [Afifellaceae bacterium]
MKRLSTQIYLTIIGSMLLVVIAAGVASRVLPDVGGPRHALETVGEFVAPAMPPPGSGTPQAALDRLARQNDLDIALYDRQRRKVAEAGTPLPDLRPGDITGNRLRGSGPPAWVVGLPDGRWVVVRSAHRHWFPALNLLAFLGAVAFAVAAGAYPIVRRLTGRLERLQTGVETLGGGDLSARVTVEGRDEVARLAESFNRSAERIEQLVGAHRLLLANVSHELRTPLSRIRIGVEILKDGADAKTREALESDIAELDRLIGQVLLSSRLDALNDEIDRETVDLLALVAEEAARYHDCAVSGDVAEVTGDPQLLRHLVRNLIENAEKHGKPPVDLYVAQSDGRVHLTVVDRGGGVPKDERERVFEPFYRTGKPDGSEAPAGTGLGLALVRQIARRHGGDAGWCADDAMPGCIRVSLPAGGNPI